MSAQAKTKNYTMDLCEGSILKKLLLFSLPLMASSVLQLFFNAADVIVVGQYAGDNSLAAVGSNGSIINLLTNVFMGLSVGANVLVARYFAAKQEEEVRKIVHTAITLSVVCGVGLAIIGFFAAKQLLIWMQSPAEVIDLAALYLKIYFLGMPAVMLYNFGAAILRGVGDTKRPLYYLTFAGVVNVVLNLVFVIVFKMDVAGVALATIISQTISAILVIRCLMKENSAIRLERQYLGVDKEIFLRILQIGLPAGVQGSLFSLSNVVIQSSVNSFGATIVAGNSAAQNIEGFVYVAMNAFAQAIVAFVSQNYGAGKYERINKVVITTLLCVLAVGAVLGNMVYLLGKPLLGLYTDSAVVMEAGMKRLSVICVTYALCGMMDSMVGAIRGLGYSVMPMIVSLIGACAFRIAWIAIFFQIERFHTIDTVYFAYPISWSLTLCVHVICYLFIWKRMKKRLNIGKEGFMKKRFLCLLLVATMLTTTNVNIFATELTDEIGSTEEAATEVLEDENNDEVTITEKDRPFLALGADLTEEQRNKVLILMGINPAELADYDVTYITNEEEHQYLGSYVEASKIGTKSLSSVVIVEREKGSGLNISTSNINYCTVGMYKNALTTAGVTDADIIIAGPSPISGTAALVGIFKSYQEMTGETIEENVIDAALNELIVTGELSSVLDQFTNEEIEEFIAYIKAVVAERELKDEDSINQVIDEACEKYGVTLSDEYRQQIIDVLLKITSIGIDLSGLVDYAESLYNNYKNGGSSTGGVIATVVNVIANVFSSIADFFKGLFS